MSNNEEIKIPEKLNIFQDSLNDKIMESNIEGGIRLDKLAVGEKLEVETQNTKYLIEKREDGFYMSGNPKYCPDPTKMLINGSTFGGNVIKQKFVGPGLYIEYVTPENKVVTTSQIKNVRVIK